MRELAVSIYLLGFNLLFFICKLFPLKNKVTFVISFPENPLFIYEQIKRTSIRPIFLCHSRCYQTFKATREPTYLIETKNIWDTVKGIYHLATSSRIVVDNYYGFLAATKFKKRVRCIQIWHALGAIKQFGTKDPSNSTRHPRAVQRFKKVYAKFDQIVVGSEFMASIFEEAFLANKESFLRIGIPRTDFFFQEKSLKQAKESLYQKNPLLKNKKIILYAPTFRKDEYLVTDIALDIPKMHEALKEDYVLMLRLHPNVRLHPNINNQYSNFVFDYGSYGAVNDLLTVTDILISDYSSIPMEFAFFKRKMIFYAYDLEQYQAKNGFWENYTQVMPGEIVKNTNELIAAILKEDINVLEIEAFAQKWSEYCEGNASRRLVEELF